MLRIDHHRRFTANHTWHAAVAGRRLFIKASPSRHEARAEREGHERISVHYPVPRLHGVRTLGEWTIFAYDRWPHLSLDAGLLLDEISHANLAGDTARLDACLTDVLGRYRQVISATLRRATLAETIGKLYGDRAAPRRPAGPLLPSRQAMAAHPRQPYQPLTSCRADADRQRARVRD